jgi:hypothetical protein
MGGLKFFVKFGGTFFVFGKQKAIEAPKITINALFADDLLDTINCSTMTLRSQPGSVLSMNLLDLGIFVVQSITEVSCGPTRFSPTYYAIIQDDHFTADLCQFIGYCQSCDPRPHNANVGVDIFSERLLSGSRGSRHPN